MGSAVGAGTIMVYTYGILAAAMGAEFSWDRNLLARNMTAFLVGSGVGTITLGWLISRYGIRKPAAIMAGSFGLLFAAIAWMPAAPLAMPVVFLLIGIAGAACTALPYSVAISGCFDARRGLALGLVVAGSGLGSAVGPRAAQYLVIEHGWRTGFASIGIAAALVSLIGIIFLVRTPEGVVAKDGGEAKSRITPASQLYFSNGDFFRIGFPILAVSMATFGAMASLVPLFKDANISAVTIASALSFAGLCSWAARVIVGYLLDKVFAPIICAAVFIMAAVGLVLLTTGSSSLHVYAGAAMVAIAMGSEADLVTFLVSRYFRLVDYSRVVGVLWVVWAWGGGIGTYLADRSFGVFHTYTPAFVGFGCLLLLGAIVVMMLGPYREAAGRGANRPSAVKTIPVH
jgi:MFS family permease